MPASTKNISGRKARENLNRNFIGTRFPHRSDMIAVWGVAVFACYTWSFFGFFNKLSSFLLYFTLGEIGDIFAFMMTIALLESLVVTGILVLLSAVFPSQWLKDGFAFKGFLALLVMTATALLFQKLLTDDYPSTLMLLAFSVVPLLVIAFLILFIRNKPKIKNLLLNIQDRMSIMLFIYVPIGLFCLIVVLYRNFL